MRAAIVCGPREGTGLELVVQALDAYRAELLLPRFDFIVVGSDRGTDHEAWRWAMLRELPALTCPARWTTGRVKTGAEGPIRNLAMYKWAKPVVVLGFPGGRGTNNMMSIGRTGSTPTYWWSQQDLLWLADAA